jgi:phage baseplate assembly protein W|tara:strand:+ start:4271 stop:4744 length:474 start_codon:yes stop_codon:yes gene_type:complete
MPTRVYSNEDGNVNKKSIVVSRTREDKDIDLTFSAKFIGLDSDGTNLRADIFKKTNAGAVKQAIRNLLLTNFTERPFMHRFGGNLSDMLFRLSTEVDDANLESDIARAIQTYEPRAQVLGINSVVSPDNHEVRITVRFLVIATLQQDTVELNLTRLR